ncbi:hypothetical protein RND81_06G050400 [Saponaria officinalis]|uniref:Uncharacterized protein n=1 Tax=Saponaria officinalis TaxID=3572 RepID=A0AAW1K6R7_SAPOF
MNIEEPKKQISKDVTPLWKIVLVTSLGAGVQFGWALQMSLLTPYVRQLGVSHTMSSLVWLCGPMSAILVQPTVGYVSDRSTSKFGRRKPYIIIGSILICLGVLLIGYAADLGYRLGDDLSEKTKHRAVALFVFGFWILDIANNMVQGPTRAFLADLSRHDHEKMKVANGFYSFFLAVGNILGYAVGSIPTLYKILPFTMTVACDTSCANLKTCFFIGIVFLLSVNAVSLSIVPEPEVETFHDDGVPFFAQVKTSIKNLGRPMWLLFLVTGLNWIAWFSYLVYNTDWVGSEIYGGKPQGNPEEKRLYTMGVRSGTLGRMVSAATLALMSLGIDPLSRLLGGSRRTWGLFNFLLAAILISTLPITKSAESARKHMAPGTPPDSGIRTAIVALYAATGVAEAATYSIPFALASMFSSDSGAGHGLSLGLINLAISVPQMLMALISGPWDSLFGGGNLPAFLLGAVAAVLSGILAPTIIPAPSSKV